MPRLPTDYSKNINYKLCCLDQSINDIYVGQTTDFRKRKNKHKSECNKLSNIYVYQFIREHGGWDNWQMIQIEEYPCNNIREAEARETYLMKELKSTLNSMLSFITKEERKENQKEYDKTDKKKEYKKEYQKEYQKTDKNKEYQKEYQKTNKYKEYQEYKKKYYKTDKYKIYQTEKYKKKTLFLNELKCYNIN